MGGWQRSSLVGLVLAMYLLPAPAFAQTTKAGVVTTLEGNVTAVRAVMPQPVLLKFRDDVFLQDRVATGDQSFARLLLGGKAVISIRERSAVTITEVPGRSTVEIESGKIALSVARDRMVPGEVIDIKTPNAVAGVRGTVVVAQVTYRQGPGGVREPIAGVLVGGYGGQWITATELSRPVTDIGAGVFLALPSRVCGLLEVSRVATWMASQTAEQCGPCFKGLPSIADDITKITMDGDRHAYDRLRFRLGVINGRGACAHPDGVIRFVATAFRVFNHDVRRHLAGNHCPPGPQVLPLPSGENEGWR